MIKGILNAIWYVVVLLLKLTALVVVGTLIGVALFLLWVWLAGTSKPERF